MGMWRNFKIKGDLYVHIHALLIGRKELADFIIKSKRTWLGSARLAINKGERIGDVAALVIIEELRKLMLINTVATTDLFTNLRLSECYSDLLFGNQAIATMMSVATTFSKTGTDYSPSTAYIIAQTHAQLLSNDPTDQTQIVEKLIYWSQVVRADMKEAVDSARAETVLRDPLSVKSTFLYALQDKVKGFVANKYSARTDQLLEVYRERLNEIDDAAPDAPATVQAITDLFREEVLKLNNWAWNEARAATAVDLDQIDGLFTVEEVSNGISKKVADIYEFTIEDHSKQVLYRIDGVKQKKLYAITLQQHP
jgi:hypothetical protein